MAGDDFIVVIITIIEYLSKKRMACAIKHIHMHTRAHICTHIHTHTFTYIPSIMRDINNDTRLMLTRRNYHLLILLIRS